MRSGEKRRDVRYQTAFWRIWIVHPPSSKREIRSAITKHKMINDHTMGNVGATLGIEEVD